MTDADERSSEDLARQYASLLQAYVKAPSESLREDVYQLGHKALAKGQGVLDVVAAHRRALLAMLAGARTAHESEEIAKRASEFLLESLAPFEMTHRGYRENIQRLIAANEALARSEADLEKRVAERTAELAISNEELRSFAYSVSHDLRAPLRHLDGFSKILLEDYAGVLDEQGKRYLDSVRNASQKMGQLIDAMLRLSRVSQVEMQRQPVDLSKLAASILADLQKDQPERRAEVKVAPDVVADGDFQLLRVALENLLENAWKFTAKRPVATIEFGTTRKDGKVVYFVKDNGAGFDMDYADKLFGAFQRLHRAEEFPGMGIGLASVQRIIRRHGGTIWAEAKPDHGATFYFTLG